MTAVKITRSMMATAMVTAAASGEEDEDEDEDEEDEEANNQRGTTKRQPSL